MPAKNSVKQFVADSYYHIYNRGVEKRTIFLDEQDYRVFNSYLGVYLLPKDIEGLHHMLSDCETPWSEKDKALKLLRLNNFFDILKLIAFCFMPNHFHFLVKQTEADTIDRFMNSLCTRYTMYFNKKYHRVGSLFQGVYKAVLVLSDEQLLQLSRYLHRNPIDLLQGEALQKYPYSSYSHYLGVEHVAWVHASAVLDFFISHEGGSSYEHFVEGPENSDEIIHTLQIDEGDPLQGEALRYSIGLI